MIYDNVSPVDEEFVPQVAEKLGLDPDGHTFQTATTTQWDGCCNWCVYEYEAFVLLVDGEDVYIGYDSAQEPSEDLTEWLRDA